ncbi:zf-HC2 domain-containing protein [Paenibacillus sp. PL91]|uniref:zf-HC2 domain-containing protein n=1 Tax=Paenibacillus sp. PL91 TaxID=2729538 RepID=UPI00145E0AC8|nr:zf-HC2 domain-containing protein [Paenibacillus sp. PL91]MBC9205127.1 zf-HC2 domain-containing protein [Paenibacillus sp. PL91]
MNIGEPKGQRLNTSCNIIYDLLPLFVDEVCSDESKVLVSEHLDECPQCKKKYEAMAGDLIVDKYVGQERQVQTPNNQLKDRSAVKVLKRIRRRWLITFLVMVLLLPTLWLSFNQYRGEGVSFTNLYDYYSAGRLVIALEQGDYDKAFEYIDVAAYYAIIQRNKEHAYSSTINREEYQLTTYEDGRQEYTNGELTIPAEDFNQWLIDAEQELVELREWYDQSPYKDMTYDEFYTISKNYFIRNLNEGKALGYTLKGRKVVESYAGDDGLTQYKYSVRISKKNHKGENGTLSFQGNGKGKFVVTGATSTPGETIISEYLEHLSISE